MKHKLFASRFFRDRRGVAAVEFALILPMMLVLLLTSVEIISFLQADRRVENTASSLADVVSQDDDVKNAELRGMWHALSPLIFPDDANDLDVRITAIAFDSDGDPAVSWCETCGGFDGTACHESEFQDIPNGAALDDGDFPDAMRAPSTTVVRVETTFLYRPRLAFFFLNSGGGLESDTTAKSLAHTSYRRARTVDVIARTS